MKIKSICKIGIDIGSTTLKVIILNSVNEIIYKVYRRHKANINEVLTEELTAITQQFPNTEFTVSITGSAGMGIAERIGIPFVQEVVASIEVIKKEHPDTHILMDLGGEDAKMVFFEPNKQPDIRMNGNCAGGTGAFIDQMADLMHITVEELGKQALQYEKIYPVASRCGVFAKTDVQNLISRNVPVPDVAMSILHTVALQSITTLAKGCSIQPKIVCAGGPLTFLPALRNAFSKLLSVKETDIFLPDNSEYFPAYGTALYRPEEQVIQDIQPLIRKLDATNSNNQRKDTLPALFDNETAYQQWIKDRKIKPLKKIELTQGKEINCFLGIDSGSTTTKILIMDEDTNIVYNYYASNEGNPLKKVVEGLNLFYKEVAEKGVSFRFISSAATGYGEDLIKSALNLDYGIVETMAHLSGAQYVDPEVSFVLDIGGQDMKSIFTHHGVISNVELNEACSSGCGSFLQNFAATMNLSLAEFTRSACLAEYPSDLGTRCTVFMNSKVKQSLRENATLGDIAAGLAYSVVKNCLFKVLKIANLNLLGEHIVVQGGTFRNDAVYRALELLSGKSVSSTDHPELMGALGAALYAQRMWTLQPHPTKFTGQEALPDINLIHTKELQCKGCTNTCSVLRFQFDNGNICYAGNKCEKVFYNKNTAPAKGYNAFETKNDILFHTAPPVSSPRGKVGIPRVLNMFENYPFWHTLFTECGYEVALSPESTFALYQKGVGSVMSDNICFPAKLVHGHILALMEAGVDRLFYPMIAKEEKELKHSTNSYNCPVVSGYPDVVRSSMEPEESYGIPFDKPVITFHTDQMLEKGCYQYFSSLGISKETFHKAFEKAMQVRKNTRQRLQGEQKTLLDKYIQTNEPVFIVAGRPYHADPLIHQKVGQILSDLGVHVLTDDVFRSEESTGFSRLNIVSQWSYPNRAVQAAMAVAKLPSNVQFIQLNSFGCGPDSFFMNEMGDILKQANKNHTVLRIDEIASPGSIRLRLRSLIESLKANGTRMKRIEPCYLHSIAYERTYTKADRQKTILAPWFADFLSPFIPAVGKLAGYKFVNLPKTTKASAETGLKYGHNEVCYPLTLVLGDIITALQSGKYDLDDVVVAVTQTGGQCRATNYLSQIKAGMKSAGFSHIPVVALATGKVYQNEQKAFDFPILKISNILIYTLLYADALQQMYNSIIVREKRKGETQELFDFYIQCGVNVVQNNNYRLLLQLLEQAVADFNTIPIHDKELTQVGLVGEIYVKYNNHGQAYISEWLRSKDMEVVTPPVLDFVMQYFVNSQINVDNNLKRESVLQRCLKPLLWKSINSRINAVEAIMKTFRLYHASESVYAKAQYASGILDLSNQFGEGWLIAAETACYARRGINRVVCIQPFGCIANHIVAKGIERRLKKVYPDMNLLYLDVDGGMVEVNLHNRLHFLM
ncbi:MAG: acyl-CoA dehydratase activase-related protein, partial [Candidatus Symbiothrix sp.]|nr:acyl-CoA dehydratase activase-related protein [Candidatus Symbiothrix sp.]